MMQTKSDPFILAITTSYVVVYKPPGLATAPLVENETDTLVYWCRDRFPEVGIVAGKKAIEGGLLHRLDRETNGIVVFAKTQTAYGLLMKQQVQGLFIKNYRAWCQKCDVHLARPGMGFPPPPCKMVLPLTNPLEIASPFRPYGPGRRQVRPVAGKTFKEVALDQGRPYKTTIHSAQADDEDSSIYLFDVQIERGFRHQIRCHLAWLGFPIVGDPLYNPLYSAGIAHEKPLALQAWAVEFQDPETQKTVRYELTSSTDTGGIV